MSELVEKVARAMCLSCDVDPDYVSDGKIMWHRFDKDARAAIAAVAEWIDEHHQIDKDGSVHCALTWQYTQKESK